MSKEEKKLKKRFEFERSNFKKLIAKNPNYFGTQADSKLKPVQALSFNTHYEELACIGYNPALNELFATFELKQESGYGGDLCSNGSLEFVRFFVNYGSGWLDQGQVAVNVHNIDTKKDCFKDKEKPLCYTASLTLKDVKRAFCSTEVLPEVRAILSWNQTIPSNPLHKPVWGNVLDCQIQIKPYYIFIPPVLEKAFVNEFLEVASQNPQLTIADATAVVNANVENPKTFDDFAPQPLALHQLAELYQSDYDFSVAPLRFSLTHLQAYLQSPSVTASIFDNIPGLNLSDIIEAFDNTKANTSYEELESLGLDYNRALLTATFKIKRPSGYSGDLCRKGSKEYVAFWADWDDDCKWSYLGTSAVNVHDLKKIDKDGICYTAVLPYDFDKFRRSCKKPKVVRLRAVLSWNTPPSTTDPDDLNTYGNRLDTHIQIKPDLGILPGGASFTILGGIPVNQIDDTSGLTTAGAAFALTGIAVAPDSPFAQRVVVQGPLHPGKKYRVQVRKSGDSNWTDVITPLRLVGFDPITGNVTIRMSYPDSAGYFDYFNNNENLNNILAWWDTSGDALWEVKLDIQGTPGVFIKRIQLNHTRPEADINITVSGTPGDGNCKDYFPGMTMKGKYVARSKYLSQYTLRTSVPGGVMMPGSGTSNTPVSPGADWSLTLPPETPRCGYFVGIRVNDKTIINSSKVGFWTDRTAGFCVREPQE